MPFDGVEQGAEWYGRVGQGHHTALLSFSLHFSLSFIDVKCVSLLILSHSSLVRPRIKRCAGLPQLP